MRILEFLNRFPDENSCREHFRLKRESQGLVCKKCGCKKHYWLKSKWQWQCSSCRFRTTLRSGTIMEHAKLPFMTWYQAIIFITFSKKGISALELQRQLNHSRYESIWSMVHKIRKAMGTENDLSQLEGMIEFDDGYFEVATPQKKKLKRGRGSKKQAKVAVMAESVILENIKTGKQYTHFRNMKMKLADGHHLESTNEIIQQYIHPQSIILSDQSNSYNEIEKLVEYHITKKSNKETTSNFLKWVHIGISNAKRKLLGIHHKIHKEYLQNYLDEFCYKLNKRRSDDLFEDLTLTLAFNNW